MPRTAAEKRRQLAPAGQWYLAASDELCWSEEDAARERGWLARLGPESPRGTHGYRPPGNDELNPKKRNKALKARKRLVVMRVLRAGPVGEAMEEEVEAGPVGEAMEEEQAGPADDDEEEDEGGEADGSSKAEKRAAKRSLDRKFASEVHSLLTGPRSGHAPPGLSGDLAQELAAVWNVSALDYLYDIERAPSEPRNQKLLLQYKNGCLPPPLLWRKDPLLANEPEGLLLPQSWPQHWYTYPRLVMLRTRARRLLLAADKAEHSPLLQAARQDAERDAAARRLAAARCATPSVAALRGTLAVCQECRGELSFDAAAAGPAPPVELRSSDCAQCLRIDIDGMVAARWPDAGKGRGRLVDLERAPRLFNPQRPG